MADSSISKRGARTAASDDFLTKYMIMADGNPHDSIKNPKGIVNMGTAVNRLMEKELEERLNRPDGLRFIPSEHQHYFDFGGTPKLKEAISDFFSRHFTGGKRIPVDQLIVLNGVTSCLDAMAYGCCDAEDVMITPAPVYGRIFTDFQDRGFVDVQPLYLRTANVNGKEVEFQLTAEILETRIKELIHQGKKVKAFVLVNPHNPLGCIYGEDLIMNLLKVCAKYKLHVVVDEIYALSRHSTSTAYTSVLAMQDRLPDPTRTHVLWGMSKDFGLAGMRVGVIHTTNRELLDCLTVTSFYHGTASLVHDSLATLLKDREWCDNFFLPTNRQRLNQSYSRAVTKIKQAGVRPFESSAALFAWIDVSPFMDERTAKEEIKLFEEMLSAGVYVVPGTILYCEQPGWMRVVVSVAEQDQAVGLERMLSVLRSRKQKMKIGFLAEKLENI